MSNRRNQNTMTQQATSRVATMIAGAALLLVVGSAGVSAQKAAPADVAAKLSGSWKLNRELSPAIGGSPGRGRGDGAGRGAAAFAVSGAGAALAGQRGGGGGGDTPSSPSDLPPDVIAAQAAMRGLQQIPEVLTVKATADTIAFLDL